jgi:hypothetical protein
MVTKTQPQKQMKMAKEDCSVRRAQMTLTHRIATLNAMFVPLPAPKRGSLRVAAMRSEGIARAT